MGILVYVIYLLGWECDEIQTKLLFQIKWMTPWIKLSAFFHFNLSYSVAGTKGLASTTCPTEHSSIDKIVKSQRNKEPQPFMLITIVLLIWMKKKKSIWK